MRTVFSYFMDAADRYANRPFLHIPAESAKTYHNGPIDLTYAQASAAVLNRQKAYADAGYGSGHRVGMLLANRAEFFTNWLALNALGVSIVPLNHEGTPQDLAYIVKNSGLRCIVTVPDYAQLAGAVVAQLDSLVTVILDGQPPPPATVTTDATQAGATTECALLYTSGSTGKPKGCMLSNDYFLLMGEWYRDLGGYCDLTPGEERLLTPLPLSHMNALACSSMAMIVTGGCIIQLDRFHPRTWWKTVSESGATALHYLGVLPAILLNLPVTAEETDNQVRFGFGAGVNPEHHAPFEDRFGFPLIEGWAMTEVGMGGCIMASEEPRHVGTCCFGKAPEWVEYRIADDNDADVPLGESGELLVRAAGDDPARGFFSGYFGMAEATAEAWAGGWFHTGDVVREGPDNSLHFVDRKKSIIRRSGENISSLEVEAALVTIPEIAQVGVAPVPDEIRGEEVMAVIILEAGALASEEAAAGIVRDCLGKLTYYKAPGYVKFVNELPLTSSQKLQRGELKTLCKDLVNSGEAFDLRTLKKRQKAAG